jgi:2,5-furandicarboxylate decarboxylase 1
MVIGGPTLDKIAALVGVSGTTDDFEVLGGFYGAPAKMVKCQTIDVMVPANAELVLESEVKCEVISAEGLSYDEGPYGEYTGMYGGVIKHNYRLIVKAMTYRKKPIYHHVTIGGLHPWYSDNMQQIPAIGAGVFTALKFAGINVTEVRAPAGGLSNIVYAKIRPLGSGDARQALTLTLTCSKQAIPKIAMVTRTSISGTTTPFRRRWRFATCRIATPSSSRTAIR